MKTQLDRIESLLQTIAKQTAPKKRKPRAANSDYPDWFEDIWSVYPRRVGSNPKSKALTAVKKRQDEYEKNKEWMGAHGDMVISEPFKSGSERYAAFCDATIEDKRFVMQAATFFGPDKHHENDWSYSSSLTLPKDNADLEEFAKGLGMDKHRPFVGEGWATYRKRIQAEIK